MTTEQKFHAPCPHGATGPFCGQCYEEGPYATIAALRAELDAARAREQQLEASLHSLCCAVCREPGAKGWCQSCFDRACKEVDQARGAWAREAKLREALKAVVNGNDIAAERNHSIEAWPGSPIRRQACAALAEGEDTRG